MSLNWSELLHDSLICVAERIDKLADFISFGAVCKGWREAGKKDHFKGLWLRPATPYLLLPDRDERDDVREFYSLVEGEIVASVTIPKFKKRKCHESLGWLLAVEEDGSMCLLDPFSGVVIPVPHQHTLPEYNALGLDKLLFVHKMVLSSRPSETTDYILMIISKGMGHLAFWRPGDESWNRIDIREEIREGPPYDDVMYHLGHFYAIDVIGSVWVFALEGDSPHESRIVTKYHFNPYGKIFYILKTSQSLFLIQRIAPWFNFEDDGSYYTTRKFQVYDIDMSTGTWVEINNIGSMAIYVGHNTTIAVDTSRFSGKIKGNHIYFTDGSWEFYDFEEEKGGGKDMGVYNLETGTIESFYHGEVLPSKTCLPIWITPY